MCLPNSRTARPQSMNCQMRCDGSKFSPTTPGAAASNVANIRRQIAGVAARFFPPGHSSSEYSIGQCSMPIFTPAASASFTTGSQTSDIRAKLSSTLRVWSRPMKVLTTFTPTCGAARITFLR